MADNDFENTIATDLEALNKMAPYAGLLGIALTHVSATEVRGQMRVRRDLTNDTPNVHGGAIMSLADTLGAVGAFLNIPESAAGTTTIESKTNFIKLAMVDDTLHAVSRPLSVGRRLSVWQTDITRDDGQRVAQVTQTQIYL